MSKESVKGHLKNARNQLDSMETSKRRNGRVNYESVEYSLEEVLAALEELEDL